MQPGLFRRFSGDGKPVEDRILLSNDMISAVTGTDKKILPEVVIEKCPVNGWSQRYRRNW
jgi:hypothetical protein